MELKIRDEAQLQQCFQNNNILYYCGVRWDPFEGHKSISCWCF
uniref:Uncharacterized protein n=1 Tax=Ciona intestinalis TaxID=7719 RepID=H2XKH8_CIOIN